MKPFHAALLLALAVPATADVLLTRNLHTDEVQTPQGPQPARDEPQTVWMGKEKLRAEMGPVTYVVRLDQRKLYLLRPAERTYSVLDLPVNLASHVPKEQEQIFEQMKSRLNVTTVVTPTDETERVHGWAARKFKVQISTQGVLSEETIWTTKDIEVDWNTFWEAQAALRSLQPGTESMVQEMRKLDGVVVKADRVRTVGERRVHTVEELVSAERKEAPEGLYDVPKDFTEKPFDTIAEVRRLVGARPTAGPGDAPPQKPDAEKEGGARRRGEKEGKGGEEKRGG